MSDTVKTSTGAAVAAVATVIFKGLAKLMLVYAIITVLIWWLVPVATAGAVVLTAGQSLAITALLLLFHGTKANSKA